MFIPREGHIYRERDTYTEGRTPIQREGTYTEGRAHIQKEGHIYIGRDTYTQGVTYSLYKGRDT